MMSRARSGWRALLGALLGLVALALVDGNQPLPRTFAAFFRALRKGLVDEALADDAGALAKAGAAQ